MSARNATGFTAALLAALAIAGCGSDSTGTSQDAASATTAAATAQTPAAGVNAEDAAWVAKACAELTATGKEVQPPVVQATSPDAAKASLKAFFGSVLEAEDAQLAAVEKVGAPTQAASATAYDAAVTRLKDVRARVVKVRKGVVNSKVKTQQELAKLLTSIGNDNKEFSEYQGPIAELSTGSSGLAAAIAADPSCKSLV